MFGKDVARSSLTLGSRQLNAMWAAWWNNNFGLPMRGRGASCKNHSYDREYNVILTLVHSKACCKNVFVGLAMRGLFSSSQTRQFLFVEVDVAKFPVQLPLRLLIDL